ncbi:MAG: hypothetical protein HFJ51_02460, partial [Clostridia bacterium]|nr:hypothetical protein [Clostridia bacterium]
MNKGMNQQRGEGGITLISLIVMIIIIIILSIVVIGKLGNQGLIDVTSDVAENYEVVSYKEQIEQVVHSTIISYSAKGEVPTLIDIADALEMQEWVRSAIPNTDTSISNGDIIVTVDKGYVYQVFYDSVYGKVIIDYIGKVPDGGDAASSLPTLKARYEKSIASIIAEARDEKNGIEKIDIIYKGQIVDTKMNPGKEERFDASKYGNGWYQVKATSNKTGAIRYAWVRVTKIDEKLTPPLIILSPATPDGDNNWYRTQISVTLTTNSPSAKDIHYRLVRNGITAPEEEDIVYNEAFKIDSLGQTEIYAWTTDGGYYSSEESTENLKFDNIS